MKSIHNLTKLIPLGSFIVILLSSLKLIIFYKVFNIDIVDYLNVQEYITLFIEDLFLLVIIFGLSILIKFSKFNLTIEKDKDENDKSILGTKLIIGVVLVTLFSLLILHYSYFDKASLPFSTTTFLIASIVTNVIIIIIFIIYIKTVRYELFLGATIFLHIMFTSLGSAFTIIQNQDKLKYTIVLAEETIITNNNLHFLGTSNEYLFLYDIKLRSSIILKRKEIKRVTIDIRKKCKK